MGHTCATISAHSQALDNGGNTMQAALGWAGFAVKMTLIAGLWVAAMLALLGLFAPAPV